MVCEDYNMSFPNCFLLAYLFLFTITLVTYTLPSTIKSNCVSGEVCKELYVQVPSNSTCENSTCEDSAFEKFKELCDQSNDTIFNRIINYTSQNYSENHTSCEPCMANDSNSINCFDQRHERAVMSFKNFKSLLDKTVVDVFLLEQNRNKCLDSYRRWLCFTQYTFYNDNGTVCKPSLDICNMVVQNCPYYTPARHQKLSDGCKQEVVYGGLPAFMCPEQDSLDSSSTYAYGKNCIDLSYNTTTTTNTPTTSTPTTNDG